MNKIFFCGSKMNAFCYIYLCLNLYTFLPFYHCYLKTSESDAMVTGKATIKGIPCAIGVMNFQFMGGSMGMVVGTKIALLCEMAAEEGLPVILFACSGGARMHEGAVSLMQMAKTCGALQRLHKAGGVSISVMTHPTTGGVTASFSSVCDFVIAEPGALIGFAGPRVIATTIKKELPKGFQRSEFLMQKGAVDMIMDRRELRRNIARQLAILMRQPADAVAG